VVWLAATVTWLFVFKRFQVESSTEYIVTWNGTPDTWVEGVPVFAEPGVNDSPGATKRSLGAENIAAGKIRNTNNKMIIFFGKNDMQ